MPTSLRRHLRSAVDQVARLTGLLGLRERANARGLTVLTYHRVLPEPRAREYPFPSLAMPLSAFREQVRWLAAHAEVLPLTQALDRNRTRPRPARPLVALTFDDGYQDAGENAATVLEEAGLRGTFFVTTGFVGQHELLWFDRAVLLFGALPERERREIVLQICGAGRVERLPAPGASASAWTASLKSCRPAERQAVLAALQRAAGGAPPLEGYSALCVAELAAMHSHGHEIGSHSVTHPILPELDDTDLRREIEEARDTLRSWLGTGVRGFCYPNGDCDARVVAAVSRAGHRFACTTRNGIHGPAGDPFRIRRVDVVPERSLSPARRFDATAFRRELCGLYRRPRRKQLAG